MLTKKQIVIPFIVGVDSTRDDYISDGAGDFHNVSFDRYGEVKKHGGLYSRGRALYSKNQTLHPWKRNLIARSPANSAFVSSDFFRYSATNTRKNAVVKHGIYEDRPVSISSASAGSYVGRYYVGDTSFKFDFSVEDSSCQSLYSYTYCLDKSGSGCLWFLLTFNLGTDETTCAKRVYLVAYSTDGACVKQKTTICSSTSAFSDPRIQAHNNAAAIFVETTQGTVKLYYSTIFSASYTSAGLISTVSTLASASSISIRRKWDVTGSGTSCYVVWVTTAASATFKAKKYLVSATTVSLSTTSNQLGAPGLSCGGSLCCELVSSPDDSLSSAIICTFAKAGAVSTVAVGLLTINISLLSTGSYYYSNLSVGSGHLVVGTGTFGHDLTSASVFKSMHVAGYCTNTTNYLGTSANEGLVFYTVDGSGNYEELSTIKYSKLHGYYFADPYTKNVPYGDTWVNIIPANKYGLLNKPVLYASAERDTQGEDVHPYSKVADGVWSGCQYTCMKTSKSKYNLVPVLSSAGVFCFKVFLHNQHRDGTCMYNRSYATTDRATYLGNGAITRVTGSKVEEVGFPVYPVIESVTSGGSGTVVAGTYYIKAIFKSINSSGEYDRSAASSVYSRTTTVTASLVVKVAPAPFISYSKKLSSKLEIYTATDTDGPYTLQKTVAYPWTTVTTTVSSINTANEALYTDDGTLENFQPPSGTCCLSDNNRMFVFPHDPDGRIYFSQKKLDGVEFSFCGQLLSIDMPKDSGYPVCGASNGGRVYALCKNGVYAISGEGPDTTGSGSFFSPQKIFDIGIENANCVTEMEGSIVFRAKNRSKYMISGGSVQKFGQEIDNLDTYTSIVCIQYFEGMKELWIIPDTTNSTKYSYVFHFLTGRWSTNSIANSFVDAQEINGRMVAIYPFTPTATLTSQSLLFGMGSYDSSITSVYTTRGFSSTANTYNWSVSTPWIQPDGFAGWDRLYDCKLLGYSYTSSAIGLSLFSNHVTTTSADNVTITQLATGVLSTIWRIDKKGDSFRFKLASSSSTKNLDRYTGIQLTVGSKAKKQYATTKKV